MTAWDGKSGIQQSLRAIIIDFYNFWTGLFQIVGKPGRGGGNLI